MGDCRGVGAIDREYVEESWGSEPFVTHTAWEGTLPDGYTEQERFVPALGYEKDMSVGYIFVEEAAKSTIETLREKGYHAD